MDMMSSPTMVRRERVKDSADSAPEEESGSGANLDITCKRLGCEAS